MLVGNIFESRAFWLKEDTVSLPTLQTVPETQLPTPHRQLHSQKLSVRPEMQSLCPRLLTLGQALHLSLGDTE